MFENFETNEEFWINMYLNVFILNFIENKNKKYDVIFISYYFSMILVI